MRCRILICFWLSCFVMLFWCPVFGVQCCYSCLRFFFFNSHTSKQQQQQQQIIQLTYSYTVSIINLKLVMNSNMMKPKALCFTYRIIYLLLHPNTRQRLDTDFQYSYRYRFLTFNWILVCKELGMFSFCLILISVVH